MRTHTPAPPHLAGVSHPAVYGSADTAPPMAPWGVPPAHASGISLTLAASGASPSSWERAYALAREGFLLGQQALEEGTAQVVLSTHERGGKLGGTGLVSVNESPFLNPYCEEECAMRIICYACRGLATYRQNGGVTYAYNTAVLDSREFDEAMHPLIPRTVRGVRWHAFGEFSPRSWDAFLSIAEVHRRQTFTAYTKRIDLFARETLPENVRIVYSHPDILGEGDDPSDVPLPANASRVYIVQEGRPRVLPPGVSPCPLHCSGCMECYEGGEMRVVSPIR